MSLVLSNFKKDLENSSFGKIVDFWVSLGIKMPVTVILIWAYLTLPKFHIRNLKELA